jgi:RNA polymerase sigma-70 factor (ECF subfamily)
MNVENPEVVEDLRATLESAIDHNGGKWLRFVLAILKNEADAEDVFQEAVCRVLVRNRPLLSPEQVRMYLGRAIGNTALEMYNCRKREYKRQIPIREHLLLPANICSPYDCMEERERNAERAHLLQMLHEGLTSLPLKQREALRLTILESRGLSIREVGITYGIPYSTLRHRSSQGLRRLRKFLERSMKSRSREPEDRSQNGLSGG